MQFIEDSGQRYAIHRGLCGRRQTNPRDLKNGSVQFFTLPAKGGRGWGEGGQ